MLQPVIFSVKTDLTINFFSFKKNEFYPFVKSNFFVKTFKHTAIWLIIFLIMFYFMLIVTSHNEALIRTFVNTLAFIALFYISNFYVNQYYKNKRYKAWLLMNLITIALLAAIRTLIEINLIGTSIFSRTPFALLSFKLQIIQFLFFLTLGHITTLLFSFYSISKFKSNVQRELAKAEMKNIELRLKLLTAQLNPHFLFNTLNSIYAISILDSKKTPELILKLSEILRFITQLSQQKRIPFILEIEQTKNLLALYSLKNDMPVNIKFNYSENLSELQLMPMTLISLIENALKYGNILRNYSVLDININQTKDSIHMMVLNTYEKSTSAKESTGLGNKILRQRLDLEYPERYTFEITDNPPYYRADLKIKI